LEWNTGAGAFLYEEKEQGPTHITVDYVKVVKMDIAENLMTSSF